MTPKSPSSAPTRGVNAPDQHIYKAVKGPGKDSIVLMDDEHEMYGPFNRSQRALQNMVEAMAGLTYDLVLAGSG